MSKTNNVTPLTTRWWCPRCQKRLERRNRPKGWDDLKSYSAHMRAWSCLCDVCAPHVHRLLGQQSLDFEKGRKPMDEETMKLDTSYIDQCFDRAFETGHAALSAPGLDEAQYCVVVALELLFRARQDLDAQTLGVDARQLPMPSWLALAIEQWGLDTGPRLRVLAVSEPTEGPIHE